MEPKSIQSELNDIFGQLAAASAPTDPQNTEPIVAPPTPVTPPTPEPVVPAQAAPATPPVVKAPDVDVDAVVDNWDASTQPAGVAPPASTSVPALDLSEFAQVVGSDVKSKEDVLKFIKETKERLEELSGEKTKLPKELVEAIEIAKKQGNYLEYLKVSSIDWSKQDPVEVFEEYVVNQMKDLQGNVDFDKVDAYLDKIDEFEKELKGKELINSYINGQRQMQASIEAKAAEDAKRKEQGLRQALSTIDNISGFKISPSHKEELYSWYTSGKMLQDLFYDQSGNLDFNKVVTTAFLNKYWDKIDGFRKQQIKNAAKRELVEELTNPSLNSSTTPAIGEPASKQYDMNSWLADIKKQKGI